MAVRDLSLPDRDALRLPRLLADQLRGRPFFVIAAVVSLTFLFAAIFAPWVAPYAPDFQDSNALMAPPSAAHWCGT